MSDTATKIRSIAELEGAALRIVLNQPKANILDRAMLSAIAEALRADVAPKTRLIVFEGEGRHFSFGASVEEHQASQAAAMLETFHGLFRQLAELAVPTCAVVRGQCLGGGLELASWCTWIVATEDARFGQPEIRLAVFPPMASLLLPWRAGGQVALDLCVGGESITAQQAAQAGLINAAVDDPDSWWRERVQQQLSKTSASSLRFAERAARRSLMRRMDQDLPWLERLYLDELMATRDANEGITAFLERRPAAFSDTHPERPNE